MGVNLRERCALEAWTREELRWAIFALQLLAPPGGRSGECAADRCGVVRDPLAKPVAGMRDTVRTGAVVLAALVARVVCGGQGLVQRVERFNAGEGASRRSE